MISYQIFINLSKDSSIKIGALGEFLFKKGNYIYTGSAKRNIDARIARHQKKDKKLHWHIDYLLANKNVKISKIEKSNLEECILNQKMSGEILISGFGSSDCDKKCGSHLKFISS